MFDNIESLSENNFSIMLLIHKDNRKHLIQHNIRISALNSSMMSQSTQLHLPKVRMLSRGGRSIKITNVKSIKPPDAELMKKQEEEKLRVELQKEIASRYRTCGHQKYECLLPVLGGRAFCAQHILDDSTAPYQQCAHVNSQGRRCPAPAPKVDYSVCFEHARAALLSRQRSAAPPPPVTTTETLLNQLQHYIRPERTRTTSCASSVSVVSDPADNEITSHSVDPFKEIEATVVNSAVSSNIMECASASESDCDSIELNEDITDLLSDTEDAPCEDQPLWRAGVFTAEEAVSEAKSVLKLLKEAYVGQMEKLRISLQIGRLQYLRTLKAEKELYCSINTQSKSGPQTVRERRQIRKLKAYASYHRKYRSEAILAKKLQKKRAKVNEIPTNRGNPQQGRCSFTEGGVRCSTHTLPATKHCLKHILHDRQQVLFKQCNDQRGGVACREPIAKLPLASNACRYHTGPPVYATFTLKKDETDSDADSHSSSESDDELPSPRKSAPAVASGLVDVMGYE
ncbi:KAT8 regulatory NSL complex subunit 2 isoform X1 [Pieris brassicae]|uniref:KAT8 regulatory NSL complex subunit 2 isoform X1 n=2 Tax=Pieris brassicae TaxID=7116 RepID=UPI001E65EDA1|nr:KAT8 regulatory NSL complex subunit 2 isoform X1 [Pieris brassicae]